MGLNRSEAPSRFCFYPKYTSTMLASPQDNLVKIFESSFRENWVSEAVTDYGTSHTLTYGD